MTRDRVDSVQAAAREDKRTVTDLKDQLERLTEKMTDMEDRSREPGLMKIRIILRQKKKRKLVVLIRKNGLWRLYATRIFGVHIIRSFRVHMIRNLLACI